MHFWIDKRSSNLHSYIGGGNRARPPGHGGFYSRTFGNRHHHPPPLMRAPSSNSSSSQPQSNQSHSQQHANTSSPNNNSTFSGNIGQPSYRSVPVAAATSMESSSGRTSAPVQSHPMISLPTFHLNTNPIVNFTHQHQQQQQPSGNGGNNHYEIVAQNQNQPLSSSRSLRYGVRHWTVPGNPEEILNYQIIGTGSDPVIGLAAGGAFNPGTSSRRPRSQSHHASSATGASGRRRSSSSGPGAFNQRRTSNRWTYDPYNISYNHQHLRPLHQAQVWQEGRSEFSDGPTNNINFPSADLPSSDPQAHSAPLNNSLTASTSTHSINDPAWKRTKRIGLTLCFMAFILLSTVAAKFVIEGPLLIDKTPRSERHEATIYFFLTELIFVVFAMALFFAGVTCLRKRTNAYLLRQFNQYIMQTSPRGGIGSPDYYDTNINSESNAGMMGVTPSQRQGRNDRPFHPNFLPSLENHLMNMHISVAESSNFVMSGLSKPPPYHIALYLPVPDEQLTPNIVGTKETPDINNKRRNSQQQSQSSSWISSCLADNENVENGKTDEETDEEGDEGKPRRKRQKNAEIEDLDRSETPPPPYGQL